jgi:hypothetical protein
MPFKDLSPQEQLEIARQSGFTDQDTANWKEDMSQEQAVSGFASSETDGYFNNSQPEMGPFQKLVEDNIVRKVKEAAQPAVSGIKKETSSSLLSSALIELQNAGHPRTEARNIVQVLEAGLDVTNIGMLLQGRPDTFMPEDAPWYHDIAFALANFAGNAPSMALGFIKAAPLGAPLGPWGMAVTGMAGSFALSEGFNATLMHQYEHGKAKSFRDYWSWASATFLASLKGGTLGALTGLAGAGAKALPLPLISKAFNIPGTKKSLTVPPKILQNTAVNASEIATLAVVGRALEGELPHARDFTDVAILLLGIKGIARGARGAVDARVKSNFRNKMAGKLRNIWAKTGITPEQVWTDALKDPLIYADLYSKNIAIPRAYQPFTKAKGFTPEGKIKIQVPEAYQKGLPPFDTLIRDPFLDNLRSQSGELHLQPFVEAVTSKIKRTKTKALPPEEQAIADHMKLSEAPVEVSRKFSKLQFYWLDDAHPFKEFINAFTEDGKFPVDIKDDVYKLVRLLKGNWGRGDHWIQFKTYEFKTLKNNGKGFAEILKPLEGDLGSFDRYLLARSALEREAMGKKTGFPIEESKLFIKKNSAKYEKIAKEVTDYSNRLLQYLTDSGLVSVKDATIMKAVHKHYVPLYRLFDLEVDTPFKSGTITKNIIKRFKGSDKPVASAIESLIKNTYSYIHMAEKQRAMDAMMRMWETNPELGKQFMTKVKAKVAPIEVSMKEVIAALKKQGIDIPELAGLESINIFRPLRKNLGENQHYYFRNGKPEIWQFEPMMSKAIKAMDPPTFHLAWQILGIPASYLRAGAVLAPEFQGRNLFRDQFSAFLFSDGGFTPFYSALSGAGQIYKKSQVFQNYLKSGAANASIQSIDINYISKNISQLNRQTNFMASAKNVITSPLEILRMTGELVEMSTRMGEFQLITGTSPNISQAFKGAFAARNVSIDFAKAGAYGRAINMITAFWNPQVQALVRMAEEVKTNPKRFSQRAIIGITIPSIMIWAVNKDQDWYKELPDWERNLFWNFKIGDQIYKIPKPHELGLIFGSIPERVMESFERDNPEAAKQLIPALLDAFSPPISPQAVKPFMEHLVDKNFFTGNPLIPRTLEGMLPSDQYQEYTSIPARKIGNALAQIPGVETSNYESIRNAAAPVVVENYIRAWSGGIGTHILQITEKVLVGFGLVPDPLRPKDTLADVPFIKAFAVRYPSNRAKSIELFYEKNESNKRTLKSIKHNVKFGNKERVDELLKSETHRGKLLKLDAVERALSKASATIRNIYRSKTIHPDDKRKHIDS